MHILMLETRRGTPDGHAVCRYLKNVEYDLPDTLARALVAAGWAREIENPLPPGEGEHALFPFGKENI